MKLLVDTNVLLRSFDAPSPDRAACKRFFAHVPDSLDRFFICPQVIYEFWVVSTRPLAANGLGLPPKEVHQMIDECQKLFPLLPDPPDLFSRWQTLVTTLEIKGRPAHDARLAALMQAYGLTTLVTLNPRDFSRFPSLNLLAPADALV